MIRFACSRCGKQYRKDDALAGRLGKCSCGYTFRVPGIKVSPAGVPVPIVSAPIVVVDDVRLYTRPGKASMRAKGAIIAGLFAGGLLLAPFFGFRFGLRDAIVARLAGLATTPPAPGAGPAVARVPGLAPTVGGSELHRKIYECYKSNYIKTGPGGVHYLATPTRIVILSVERREIGTPPKDGIPYYAKVRLGFQDGTEQEADRFAFFVKADKSVWFYPWNTLGWHYFLKDAGTMPSLPTDPERIVNHRPL